MTKAEHVRWLKGRALEYVQQGDMKNAIASVISDLGKHPGTQALCGPAFMYSLNLESLEETRRWINGFIE